MPTHLSLFSGIGGIDLAAHWAGFQTVAFCEREPFCRRVLARHWPGVPCFEDVRALTATSIRSLGFLDPVDLLSGGYPCQPYSLAGKGKAAEDHRALWPEMRRLVGELRPAWVLGENVPGHLNRGLDDVLLDLKALAYEARVFVFPAEAVGACHRRERLFVVAHNHVGGCGQGGLHITSRSAEAGEGPVHLPSDGCPALANPSVLGWGEIGGDEPAPTGPAQGSGHDPRCREEVGHPGGPGLPLPEPEAFHGQRGGKKGEQLPNQVQGPLSPAWCEMFMGFPQGWTDPDTPGSLLPDPSSSLGNLPEPSPAPA